ncbi:hypothetical protein DFH06DRAFT_7361 [Mycena polygramma]|nr:hypothetical protein DFH06DRAFT_7361 [Mycena polygramma]
MSSRSRTPCTFFREGRCRYGQNCNFSHSTQVEAPTLPQILPSTSWIPGSSFTVTPSISRDAITPSYRSYEAGPVDYSLRVVEAINALRVSAEQEPLERTNKFFQFLDVTLRRLEEDDLEAAAQALRDALPFDYNSDEDSHNSDEDSHDGTRYGDSEDEDFGDMDLFSPLKKSTPEYREPAFAPRQTANYQRNSYSLVGKLRQETFFDWDLLDNTAVVNVQFGANFSIEDSHITGLSARPTVCQRLQRFVAGDTDTGNGGGVRNEAAFIQFVRICSSVRVFRLEAFTSLSDATLLAIFQFCPRIEMVQLTGHDKSHGRVSGTALKTLARTPAWAPHLKALYLHDQTHKLDAGVKVLSAARPALWIFTGETLGNSMSAQMVASMPGGDVQSHTWLGGKIVSIASDGGSMAYGSDYW